MTTWRLITKDLRDLKDKDLLSDDADEQFPDKASADIAKLNRKKPHTQVSLHLCPHAAGEPASEWWDCRNDPRSQYEEF